MIIIITTNMFTSTILMFLSTVLCFVCFWFGTTCRRTYMPCGSLFCCSCVAVFHVLMANKMTMISVTLSSRLHSGRGRGKRKRWKRNEREWSKNQREEFYEKMEVGKHEWSRRGGGGCSTTCLEGCIDWKCRTGIKQTNSPYPGIIGTPDPPRLIRHLQVAPRSERMTNRGILL